MPFSVDDHTSTDLLHPPTFAQTESWTRIAAEQRAFDRKVENFILLAVVLVLLVVAHTLWRHRQRIARAALETSLWILVALTRMHRRVRRMARDVSAEVKNRAGPD